mgnify:CR=1 FL=1
MPSVLSPAQRDALIDDLRALLGDRCSTNPTQLEHHSHGESWHTYALPDVVVLPIGDHFTMGPREAAVALELLGTTRCVPCPTAVKS